MQMAKPGQKVSVRYRGTLAKNGKVFDETKGNKTFSLRLGEWARPLFIMFHVVPCTLYHLAAALAFQLGDFSSAGLLCCDSLDVIVVSIRGTLCH